MAFGENGVRNQSTDQGLTPFSYAIPNILASELLLSINIYTVPGIQEFREFRELIPYLRSAVLNQKSAIQKSKILTPKSLFTSHFPAQLPGISHPKSKVNGIKVFNKGNDVFS